jgi:hypothetical protein
MLLCSCSNSRGGLGLHQFFAQNFRLFNICMIRSMEEEEGKMDDWMRIRGGTDD